MATALSFQVFLVTVSHLFISNSNCYSIEEFSSVIVGATNYFNSHCVNFLAAPNIQANLQTVATIKVLSAHFIPSGSLLLKTSAIENKTTLLRDCNSQIFVMTNKIDTRSYLDVLLNDRELYKNTWILFLNGLFSFEEYLFNVNIPFNCEFLVAERDSNTGVIRLTEIYRLVNRRPLQTYSFGYWSLERGFVGPPTSFYDRRTDLKGLTFITSNNNDDAPITYLHRDETENTTELGGFSGNVWRILETRMGFLSDHRVPADDMWGSQQEDGLWDGMIGDLLYDKANMTAIGITMTSERAEYVRFTTLLFVSYVRVYIREPLREVTIWGLVSPFKPTLWAALVVSVAISSLILTVLCKLEAREDILEGHYSLKDIFYHCFVVIFCQQSLISNPQALSKRIVIFIVYLIGTVTLSAYSGSLISCLAVTKLDLPFTSLHGLLEDGTYSLGMVKTTWYHNLFKNAKKYKQSVEVQELYERVVSTDPRNTPNTYEEGFKRACDERYGFISEEESFYSMSWDCTLQSLPVNFAITSISYAFPKNSPYLGLFNHNLLKLMNNGVLKKLYNDALNKNLQLDAEVILPAASLDTVMPILLVLCAGYIISLFLLALEMIVFHLNNVDQNRSEPYDEHSIT